MRQKDMKGNSSFIESNKIKIRCWSIAMKVYAWMIKVAKAGCSVTLHCKWGFVTRH